MTSEARVDQQLALVLLDLAGVAVRARDAGSVPHRLTEQSLLLPGVEAAGVITVDARGGLGVATASNPVSEQLQRTQAELDEGPGTEAVRSGRPLTDVHLHRQPVAARWPRFAPHLPTAGSAATTVLPLRHGEQVFGGLSLFHRRGALPEAALQRALALVEAAAVGIAHDWQQRLIDQLETALKSRIAIEQAKGMLAERLHCTVDKAFTMLRSYARSHNTNLTQLARTIIDGPPDTGPFPRTPVADNSV